MKLKDWNDLDKSTRRKLASVIFALDGEEKILLMSKQWKHHLDDEHRKLLKSILVKDNKYKIIMYID